MTRISAGPYSLDLQPNSRATLFMADGAGEDHEMPWGLDHLDALIQFAGEVIRLNAQLAQMQVDRRDGDLAIRDAISETARTADELAFWKFQAIYHRALILYGKPMPGQVLMLEGSRVWREAETQLEEYRTDENRERYAHAEAPRDPGAT